MPKKPKYKYVINAVRPFTNKDDTDKFCQCKLIAQNDKDMQIKFKELFNCFTFLGIESKTIQF